jgi:hypothetical protein
MGKMLSEELFLKGMAILAAAYPEHVIKPETMKVYREFLSQLTPEQFERSARRHITRSPYFPKISEILKAAREDFPSAVEVWNKLIAGAEAGKKPELDPAAEKALAFIGGFNTVQYTPYPDLRFRFKDFERAYSEALDQKQDDLLQIQREVKQLEHD